MQRWMIIVAAVAWLAFLVVITIVDQARLNFVPVFLSGISIAGLCLAVAMLFARRRWMAWASLLLSVPVACLNFICVFQVISLLRLRYGFFAHAHVDSVLGQTPFLWFCLLVAVVMLLMPIVWLLELRGGHTA